MIQESGPVAIGLGDMDSLDMELSCNSGEEGWGCSLGSG